MSAPLKVLGDRVLVKPDLIDNAPETTESGVILAKSMASAVTGTDPTLSFSRGTVVGLGTPRHPLKDEAEALAVKLSVNRLHEDERHHPFTDAAAMLRDLVRRQPAVQLDDDVLFSHDAGQQITLGGETYVILHEAELLAVVES